MNVQEELFQVEAERDRLLSMIAYHGDPYYSKLPERGEKWLAVLSAALVSGVGIFIIASVTIGQADFSLLLFLALLPAFIVSLGYVLTRKITAFGLEFWLGVMVSPLGIWPSGPPAGEPQVLQRLAECEARIVKLKEIGSSPNGPQV
jgi:hypothetical protein